jgi:hypothetical protein
MKKRPIKIKLEFSIAEDNPLKDKIFEKFSELMKLLEQGNTSINKPI